MKAPGLAGGRRIEGARLIDAAPTILDLLGYDVPLGMIGRPIAQP